MLQPNDIFMTTQCLKEETFENNYAAKKKKIIFTCKYIISLKVRWASVALRNASKHFFKATTALVRFSIAFHTIPYAYKLLQHINHNSVKIYFRFLTPFPNR